jgi:hypothetical protein
LSIVMQIFSMTFYPYFRKNKKKFLWNWAPITRNRIIQEETNSIELRLASFSAECACWRKISMLFLCWCIRFLDIFIK